MQNKEALIERGYTGKSVAPLYARKNEWTPR
jgi:hypothetical protein